MENDDIEPQDGEAELDESFFATAILTRPSESIVEVVSREREKDDSIHTFVTENREAVAKCVSGDPEGRNSPAPVSMVDFLDGVLDSVAIDSNEIAERVAELMPSSKIEPFTERAMQIVQRFTADVTEHPEDFPRTVAFMQSMNGRERSEEDDRELGRIYTEEAYGISDDASQGVQHGNGKP